MNAGGQERVGRGVGDVQKRHARGALDLIGHLVHGVRTDHDRVGTCGYESLGCAAEEFGASRPVTLRLLFFHLGKVHAVEDDLCGMEAAQRLGDALVDFLVVGDGALPTHAAQESDRFHNASP